MEPPSFLNNKPDEFSCKFGEKFPAKAYYEFLSSQDRTSRLIQVSKISYKSIWIKFVPPKVQLFMWMVLQNALATKNDLINRGCEITSTRCSFYTTEGETITHLFLRCTYATEIWSYFLKGFNQKWDQSKDMEQQMMAWKFWIGRKIWPLMIFSIIWVIWKRWWWKREAEKQEHHLSMDIYIDLVHIYQF